MLPRAVQLSIDAELGGGQDKELLFSLQGPGIVIEDRDGGTVRQTVRIGPGRYFIAITATAVAIGTTSPSGSASFSLSLVFAP